MNRPTPGGVEQRTAPDAALEGRKLRGLIPYGVESRDLDGWREVIEPGALAGAKLDDLVATVDHAGIPIGRYPTTLGLEERDDGAHWALSLPESRSDVREAVERGDLKAGSWRMVVKSDEWRGDTRHIQEIGELLDVSVVTSPAYPTATTEYRSTNNNPGEAQEDTMGNEPEVNTETVEPTEERAAPVQGGLQVEDRASTPARPKGLAEEFRAAGFPGETATIDFDKFAESRAITWTGSVDKINVAQASAGPFGADQRFAWPAFPQVAVDAGATSVDVATQTARSLATPANVVRAIDAITAKPETGSTLTVVTTALKQVASIYSNVPNIHLEQPAFNTVIETDLRLAINGGLDKLILDAIATSGFQAPGTDPLLISIRKAMTTIQGSGYNPDVLLLTPANAEALDTLRATGTATEQYYVFAPAQLAPRNIFGLSVRISKDIPAPAVVDSTALGRLYTGPVSLARVRGRRGHHQPAEHQAGAQLRVRRRAHRRSRQDRRRVSPEPTKPKSKPKAKSMPKAKPISANPAASLALVGRARRGR